LMLFASVDAIADDTAIAKEKIEEGKRLIGEEKYAEALEALEASYKLRPKPTVLFNIAMCKKALHRYVDAIASFKLFLKTETSQTSTTRALAESALAELERFVGKVRLVEAPVGADVYIDGKKVGVAPLKEPLPLDPGRHVVRVSKDRFKTLDVEVIVASGAEVEVRADLQQPKAELKVACKGDKTVVFIDEAAVGTCPYQGSVEAGVHEVKVIEPGKETFIQTVEAAAGSTLVIAVDLKPVILIKPPTFITEPSVDKEPTRAPMLLRASGIGTAGAGVVSLIIGGIFNAKWNGQYDLVKTAAEATDRLNQPYNEDEWKKAHKVWDDANNRAVGFRNGFIVGYAVGGALVVAGGALWAVGRIKAKRTPSESLAVRPQLTGVMLEF